VLLGVEMIDVALERLALGGGRHTVIHSAFLAEVAAAHFAITQLAVQGGVICMYAPFRGCGPKGRRAE